MQLGVRRLQIVELYWFAEKLLVERQGEAAVDVVAVENRQSHHAAHEVEVRQVVLGDAGKEGETGTLVFDGFQRIAGALISRARALTGLMEESGLICSV